MTKRPRSVLTANIFLACAMGLFAAPACQDVDSPADEDGAAATSDELTTYDANGVAAESVKVTLSGTTASGTYTIKTKRLITFKQVVLAVRDGSNGNFDFAWNQNARVWGSKTFSGSKAGLPTGTYSANVAYTLDGQTWLSVGAKVSFTVGGAACAPTTCAAQKATCGSISDGCGGTLSCGGCTAPQTCGGGGVANVCGAGAPASGGFGLLANGLRDKTKWPFASTSIWNTPIGSSAAYKPANIKKNNSAGYTTFFHPEEEIILMTPTAPMTEVRFNSVGWSGGDRCATNGRVLTSLPVPSGFVIPNSGENNSAAFLAPDGRTVLQNQPFTRCKAGGPATTLGLFKNEDIYGAGITGAHGGSGLSALGGTVRYGELTAGQIRHALKVTLRARDYYSCCSPIWPAYVVDNYANSTTYGGSDPKLGSGSLLALLPSFDPSVLKTAPAKILAAAFRDYGAYAVDDAYANGWAIAFERGGDGRVADEAASRFGVALQPKDSDPFMSDIVTIFQSLQIVTNNGPSSVGGGGTPRVPVAPAIGN